jgi:hypothetical protein
MGGGPCHRAAARGRSRTAARPRARRASRDTRAPPHDAGTGLTPQQIIDATIREAVLIDNPMARLLFESLPSTARDPRMRADLGAMLARYRALLADRIRACHPQPAAEPEALAALIAAALDGLALHVLADPDLDIAALVRPLLQLLGPTTPTADRHLRDATSDP